MKRIRLGLPKGSLNTVGRGNTHQLFVDAGYDIKGYEPGKESGKRISIVNDPEIVAFLGRPQSAPVELSREMLDIAIIGEDWVREESVRGEGIRRIGDLEYGQIRLVIAVAKEKDYGSLSDLFRANRRREKPILCFAEYPNLTRQHVMQNPAYKEIFGDTPPLVQARGLVNGENDLVQIIYSDGETESYIEKGADFIADSTQTGSTLKEYGLKELETIMHSSTGLYAGPSCTGWKEEKAKEIFEMLHGVVIGKKYFDVKFNVPNEQVEATKRYLIEQGLCADEPTVSKGERFSAFNVLIPREKYPGTVSTLKGEYGVTALVRNEVKQFTRE
jgi:ATP phosphoribosyltransferase